MPNRRNAVYSLLILTLLGGLFTGRTFFFNMAYLFAALLILSLLWSWASVSNVQISRQTRARRAQVGRPLDEQFGVRNAGPLPKLWLEVRDHSDLPGHNASSVVPTLLPLRSYRWSVRTTCVVRGEFTLGPITLISGDPFGLFQMTRHIDATSRILVYPRAVPLYDFALPTGVLSGGDAQRQRAPYVTTNAAGIRDYSPGDSLNRIHWRSTARKDRLLVKEFDLDPLADIWLLLDLSSESTFARPYTYEGGLTKDLFIPPSSAEYGIVIAASLASYFLVKERALGFATYNPNRTIMQPDRGNRQLTRIYETLALAKIVPTTPFGQLVALEGHHMMRGTTAILVTADPSDGWVKEAQLMVRRGVRAIAIVLDPQSFLPSAGVRSGEETRRLLEGGGVITYLVHHGDDLTAVLSQRR
jgi:uncharacterized protein (DUF58 family)